MNNNISFIIFMALFCLIHCAEDNESKIPLILWSMNGIDPLSAPKSSLIDDIYPEDLLQMYHVDDGSKQTQKIAFLQNDLNIEQFSQNNLPFLSRLFDENDAMFFPYSKYEPEFFESKFEKIIRLPEDTLEKNEPIIQSYVEQFNQTLRPTIFMLTGEKNSVFDELNQSKIRVRRSADIDASKVLKFPNDDQPCAYMYTTKIDLMIRGDKDSKPEDKNKKYEFTDIIVLNGTCENVNSDKSKKSTSETRARSIEFQMKNTKISKTFTVKMFFDRDRTSWWGIKSIELAEIGGGSSNDAENEYSNRNLTINNENGFSYSCSKKSYRLFINNSYVPGEKFVEIQFNRFQIQPFVRTKSLKMFEKSFDCAVWFTLPIISSLIVSLLLILILFFGIRAVMSISTPDRFENPKSKGLILGAVDE
ncbi:V-type proton ATPase subunit [Dermatophagoides pteronyssinus]|uniref:V-type proton ATPase subunit n=1 Tax=Dermatophagoides pteronyssinus TaxID=6956 RepID=A0ABQ8JLF1_DERPT|nr:V-type proton ATPase subunit [Dermatophagoides pteronyssinus]